MKKNRGSQSGAFTPRIFAAFLLCSVAVLLSLFSFASTPSSGTLTDVSGPITYTAGPFFVANHTPLPQLDSGPRCNAQLPCDSFALTTNIPATYLATNPNAFVKVTMFWTDAGSGKSDYDLPIIKDGLIYVIDIRNGLYILRYTGPHADEVQQIKFLEGNSNLGDALRLAEDNGS